MKGFFMNSESTDKLSPKDMNAPRGNNVTIFIRKELDSIPLGQGLRLTDLIKEVIKNFPDLKKRNVYVKVNHIIKAKGSKYSRYTSGKKGTHVFIGKTE
jgi:hypothetical protein